MRHMIRAALAAAVLTLGAAACSDGGGNPAGPSASMGKVTLTNNSNATIIEVNYGLCTDSEWGPNRLSAGETIVPGASRSFNVTPGCYDFRAHTGSKYGIWWDKQVSAGGTLNLALSPAANDVSAYGVSQSQDEAVGASKGR